MITEQYALNRLSSNVLSRIEMHNERHESGVLELISRGKVVFTITHIKKGEPLFKAVDASGVEKVIRNGTMAYLKKQLK